MSRNRRMQALFEQFGPELVTAVSQEMLNYSETILRKRIAEIPDGDLERRRGAFMPGIPGTFT